MRPIRLCMAAFGPFAGVEDIDFTVLGDNPLFLINGPTGSGKSTILDAICFALYGETTGNEREAKQMRCDQADPALLTEVTLEFALASGVYRIVRIPDQERPKARGEGVTEQKARAELYRLEGDKESLLVAPKITDVTNEIINLTGLSAEQFRQVMVLPQGKFRDLLLAKSEDRETIFQQLFQTHVYSTLQARLRDQANALLGKLRETQLQQRASLETHDLESGEQLQAELDLLAEQITDLSQQKQQAAEKLAQVQTELQQARQLETSFVEQAQAKIRLTGLEEKQAEVEQQKRQLDHAGLAGEIEPLYQNLQKLTVEYKDSQDQQQARKQGLARAESVLLDLETEKQKLPQDEKELAQVEAKIVELDGYRQRSVQLNAATQAMLDAQKEQALGEQRVSGVQKQIELARACLDTVEVDIRKNNTVIAELPEKKVYLDKLEAQGKSLRKIDDIQNDLKKLEEIIVGLGEDEGRANSLYQQKVREKEIYEQAWQNGQAAILAGTLQDNEACPVCGSTDHPAIATSADTLPSELELNKVKREAEEARVGAEKLSRERLLKEEEKKNLFANLDEEKDRHPENLGLSLEAIRESYKLASRELDTLQNTAATLPGLQKQLDETKQQPKILEQELGEAQKSLAEQSSAYAAAKADVQNKQAELPEMYRQEDALEKAIAQALAKRDRLKQQIESTMQRYQQAREARVAADTALTSAQANLKSIENKSAEATKTWQSRLQHSAFENEQVFFAARMEKSAQDRLASDIRQYEDELLLAGKQLDEKSAAIADRTRPDINQLSEREGKAVIEKNEIDTLYHKACQRREAFSATQDRLKQSLQKQKKLEKEYGLIGRLSDVSNGKNPHNLSLQRFVLSVLLDDVLTEASYRLHKMSKGRYQLYRKETVGDKRSKAGLELEVEDAYTGRQRPAATLSGGESFMAALALALGLSDVVQAYAGGIRLDALFIDEGFGSLDPESLDLAINTLLDLRASGRMVGIISHVEEMKRIIDLRLDVIADRGVSYTRLVSA